MRRCLREMLVEVSGGLGEAMVGINLNDGKVERFDVV